MKDKIYYYDHNGNLRLTLNEYPYYSEPADLKNWSWGYNEQFGQISNFFRGKEDYTLSIGIAGEHMEARDALCDIFTEDILANEPGYLMLRGWKLYCFITEAEYEYGLSVDRRANFLVRPVNSTWIRTNTKSYNGIPGGGSLGEDYGRDYTYESLILGRGYNFGYSEPDSHRDILDFTGTENGYEVLIYGPQINPVIYLDNNPIGVNVELDSTEKLKIVSDGNIKTIEIIKLNGTTTDAFIYRDKQHSPFINIGKHAELTYGNIRFDMTYIERRSEPAWI